MDYDLILEHLGEVGRWNVLNQGLIWIPSFISGVMVLVYSFTGTGIILAQIFLYIRNPSRRLSVDNKLRAGTGQVSLRDSCL